MAAVSCSGKYASKSPAVAASAARWPVIKRTPISRFDMSGIEQFAQRLGIDADDAETLVSDIIPMLVRKYELMQMESPAEPGENRVKTLLDQDVPKVLANYALAHLTGNKVVQLYIVKKVSPELTDEKVRALLGIKGSTGEEDLAQQLAVCLCIRDANVQDFIAQVLPKLKKYTKAMYQKKITSGERIDNTDAFNQFIIDNVFIDEFENHPFIRSVTDENNQAILLPESRSLAMRLITLWMNEVTTDAAAS
jgi:hypothetical protein